jgi:hypothetical protein
MEDALVDENSGSSDKDWIYGENIVFCRDTFFCCDHRQSAPDSQGRQPNWEEEQERRWAMRKEIFPQLRDDAIILGNFNQLYKVCSPESHAKSNTKLSTDRTHDVPDLAAHSATLAQSYFVASAIPRSGRDKSQADSPYVGRP